MQVFTVDVLRRLRACIEQQEIFEKLFPSGSAPVTAEALDQAAAAGLFVGWLADKMLTEFPRIPAKLRQQYSAALSAIWRDAEWQMNEQWAGNARATVNQAEYDLACSQARARYTVLRNAAILQLLQEVPEDILCAP